MNHEGREEDRVREFRLEGASLVALVALIVIGLGAAFYVGRWYERRRGGSQLEVISGAGEVVPGDADAQETGTVAAEEGLDYFDSVEGEGKELEPSREARPPVTEPAPPPEAEADPGPRAPGGPFYVQVFAGRDRRSAESLASGLREAGFPVEMHTEKEGQTSLFKVRVGGYPDRETAGPVADDLKAKGYTGAFVKQVE